MAAFLSAHRLGELRHDATGGVSLSPADGVALLDHIEATNARVDELLTYVNEPKRAEPTWWTVLKHEPERQAWVDLGEALALTGEDALRKVVFGTADRLVRPEAIELGTFRAMPLLHCRDLSIGAQFGATPTRGLPES